VVRNDKRGNWHLKAIEPKCGKNRRLKSDLLEKAKNLISTIVGKLTGMVKDTKELNDNATTMHSTLSHAG